MDEDDSDLWFEGTADANLVRSFTELRFPTMVGGQHSGRIGDPELLARLIDAASDADLQFRIADREDKLRVAGTALFRKIKTHKAAAAKLIELESRSHVVLLEEVATRLVANEATVDQREKIVAKLIESLETLATWPLKPRNPFARRPRTYESARRVVGAVAEYCRRMGMDFKAPGHEQARNNQLKRFRMTDSAHLTLAVLTAYKPFTGVERTKRARKQNDHWPTRETSLVVLMNGLC